MAQLLVFGSSHNRWRPCLVAATARQSLFLSTILFLSASYMVAAQTTAGVNECLQTPSVCGGNSTCMDTPTYFKCICPNGYYYDRALKTCVDVNECALTDPPCVSTDDYDTTNNTVCVNTPGSYRCDCAKGYQVVKKWIKRPYMFTWSCDDIDECATQTAPCVDPAAKCVNREGTFRCRCPDKYYYSAEAQKCLDVDECATGNPPCGGSSYCVNTAGGYACACPPKSGLAYVASVDDCVVDLCAQGPCGGNSTCGMATVDTYYCGCPPGFAYNTTKNTCTPFLGLGALTVAPGQTCVEDTSVCPIIDGSTCGLYFGANVKDTMNKLWPCNRMSSPNGVYKLVLQYSGQLAIFNRSSIIWSTAAPSPRERRSLLLQEDGTWALWGIDVAWGTDYSWYYGNTTAENTGPDLGPFTMRMGNDGRAVIVNRLGAESWSSK